MTIQIVEVADRSPVLLEQLVRIWQNSVEATHLFLMSDDIQKIKRYVPQALNEVPLLILAEDQEKCPIGFMGIAAQTLEMLFISNDHRGNGVGRSLLQYGIDHYAVNQLTVNEQNPKAKGFYEHMGFHVYQRTDRDEHGNPYPLLYMKKMATLL